ncbi:MAG: hypothetical protein H0T69_00640 [Thermoleophilaceae bacterium]|nr:hypothetical protein [Thermoleophilaceae bacterium]
MGRLAGPGATLLVTAALAVAPAGAAAAPGELDGGFGVGGVAPTPGLAGGAVALQPDGKIVVAGVTPDSRFAVARYNADGSPDKSFGGAGLTATTFGTTVQAAYDLAVQPDGAIVAVGTAGEDFGRRRSFALARFTAGGTLDPTFGGDGKVTTDVGGASINDASGVALQADAKIVLAGYAAGASGGPFAVARYNADGTLDPSFGSGGAVTTNIAGGAVDVAIGPRRRIVAGGLTFAPGGQYDFALARYRPEGAFDFDFGFAGRVFTDLGASDALTAIAVGKVGRVTAVGSTSRSVSSTDFAAARYTRDGRRDSSFDGDGLVTTTFGVGVQIAYAVALDAGKTVVAGLAHSSATGDDVALARYKHNGQLDSRFGAGGRVLTDLVGANNSAHDLAIQSDGAIVVIANGALLRYAGR